jgi:hypothetical protein
VKVELRYFDGCPNWQTTEDRLMALQPELRFSLTRRLVETPEEAERLGFRGSPTILVDGIDPFAVGDEPIGLACRIYRTPVGPSGSPTAEQLRKAVTR